MNRFQKGLFDKLNEKATINPDDVYQIADSVKRADFSNEATVRNLVRRLSKVANKPLSQEKEDKIVQTITKNKMPNDMQSLNKLFKK